MVYQYNHNDSSKYKSRQARVKLIVLKTAIATLW